MSCIQTLAAYTQHILLNHTNLTCFEAAHYGYDNALKIKLKHGARVDKVDEDGNTMLMIAAKRGMDEVAETVLKYTPDVTLKNNDGLTALDCALAHGKEDIAHTLLAAGAGTEFGETEESVSQHCEFIQKKCSWSDKQAMKEIYRAGKHIASVRLQSSKMTATYTLDKKFA
ncbi:MAG: ankyrin repeat domain-containing protein [Shewanella sp.]|nr:ankyrin repeat domain-containing protein [Shewanella sp.]